MSKGVVCTAMVVAVLAAPVDAQAVWDEDRPDAQAPVGVPYAQLLPGGAITIGYRYDYSRFGHLRTDVDRVDPESVFWLGYGGAPEAMNAHRHTVELMYAPSGQVTLVAELPYVHRTMTEQRLSAQAAERRISGVGDLRLGTLLEVLDAGARRSHMQLLVGIPTGPASERDEGTLVYAQQPGSGTVHLRPALTFTEQGPHRSWGAQVGGTVHIGESGEGFTMGNRLDLTAWGAWQLLPWASTSLRIAGEFWGDVRHDVPDFPATPAAEPGFTGGQRVDLLLGSNLQAVAGTFVGHRLFLEVGLPLYQSLDGPQLGMSWRGSLGWRWAVGEPSVETTRPGP